MPLYEYECAPCLTIYEVPQRMSDPPLETCPKCHGPVARLISAPNVNRYNYSSPTQAKYGKLSASEEIAKERALQKEYQTVWLPPPVKHSPWDDD
jgi:putative FmdB family regulatory protein